MKTNEENANINGKLLSNQIATRNTKEKKLGRLSFCKNWTRTFVLRIFVCFSRHIALVCRALNANHRNVLIDACGECSICVISKSCGVAFLELSTVTDAPACHPMRPTL